MNNNITEQEFVKHCSKLLWGINWASCHHGNANTEHISNKWGDYYIPNGLCDEDKFLCFLLTIDDETCLCSSFYIKLLGWTRYKVINIRNKIPYLKTVSCIGENGGYNGKGWAFDYEFNMKIYKQHKKNKSCLGCASPYSIEDKGEVIVSSSFFCPEDKELISDTTSSHCNVIKLMYDDEFKNFWK